MPYDWERFKAGVTAQRPAPSLLGREYFAKDSKILSIDDGITWTDFSFGSGTPSTLAVRYAAPWGNDSNDGLGWGSAKQYVMSAFDSLPSTGGQVYFADSTYASATGTDHGIWMAGASDPNFGSLPSGWRQLKRCEFIGVGGSIAGRRGPQAIVLGGSTTDSTKPLIALSCLDTLAFENLCTDYIKRPIRIGMMSNGTTQNTGFLCCTFWRNIQPRVTGAASGPNISIESSANTQFWHHFEWCDGSANSSAAIGTDARSFMATTGTYLLTIQHAIWTYGGLKFTTPGTSWNLRVDDMQMEGDFVNPNPPLVDIYGNQTAGFAKITYCSVFDSPGTTCVIRNNALSAECVIVDGIGETGTTAVKGPHTNLGFQRVSAGSLPAMQAWGPQRFRDSHRRQFGPTSLPNVDTVQFAFTNPTSWSGRTSGSYPAGGNATVTATSGRFGGPSMTGRLSWTGTNADVGVREVQASTRTLAVGDFIVFGVWLDLVTKGSAVAGFAGASLIVDTAGFSVTQDLLGVIGSPAITGSGGYVNCAPQARANYDERHAGFSYCAARVTAIGTNPCSLIGSLFCYNGDVLDVFGPNLLHFPGSSWSAEQVSSYIDGMNSFPYSPTMWGNSQNRAVTLQQNQDLYLPGGGIVSTDGTDVSFFGNVGGTLRAFRNGAGALLSLGASGVNDWQVLTRTQASTADRLRVANGATVKAEFSTDAADTETELLIARNIGGTKTLQRVSMGAADSGGAGFKLLRVPN